MKKATKFTIYLSIWIVCLCSTGMFMTYFNDALQQSGFFADVKLGKEKIWDYYEKKYVEAQATDGTVDKFYRWGDRHYWYYWMCVILFIISIARICIWVYNYWEKEINS